MSVDNKVKITQRQNKKKAIADILIKKLQKVNPEESAILLTKNDRVKSC
jgi:hypothetical protein